MRHFCVDIDATKTAELLELNRKTINRYFLLFREAIFAAPDGTIAKARGKH